MRRISILQLSLKPAESGVAGIRRVMLCGLGNVANLQHCAHPDRLVPQDVAMHEPNPGIVKRKSQRDVSAWFDIHSVLEQRGLGVDMLGFFLGDFRLEGVIRAAEVPLARANNVKDVSVLHWLALCFGAMSGSDLPSGTGVPFRQCY